MGFHGAKRCIVGPENVIRKKTVAAQHGKRCAEKQKQQQQLAARAFRKRRE